MNNNNITYEHKDLYDLLSDKAPSKVPTYDISIYDQQAFPIPPGVEMELVGISKDELAELKERLRKTQELELEVRKENAQLKELLKECRDEIEYLRKHYKGNIDRFKNNTILDKEINQALGEDK